MLNDRLRLILSSFSLGLSFAWIAVALSLGDKLSGLMAVLFMLGSISLTVVIYQRIKE